MTPYDLLVIGGGVNGAGIARDAAGRGLSRPLVREGRPGAGHLLAQRQAGAWRPALSRILRVPPGARGADRARGAARGRAAHHLAHALRAAAFAGAAPGLAGAPRPLSLRPSRRPQQAARYPRHRPRQRSGGRADQGRLHPRLRILRLLGRRFPPGRAQRARCPGARCRNPHAHRRAVGPARRRCLDRRAGRCVRAAHRPRPLHRQCGRAVGRGRARPASTARRATAASAW